MEAGFGKVDAHFKQVVDVAPRKLIKVEYRWAPEADGPPGISVTYTYPASSISEQGRETLRKLIDEGILEFPKKGVIAS